MEVERGGTTNQGRELKTKVIKRSRQMEEKCS